MKLDAFPRQFPIKVFPWRRRGVLLPVNDRRASALGVCMFTASKPHVLALQRASFWFVRLGGGRALPGRRRPWTAPFTPETWSALLEEWRSTVGSFDALAVYQRRQSERDGLTLLLTRSGSGIAVVKVRSEGTALHREQQALAAIATVQPGSFRAPAPLGSGSMRADLHWSAQSSVFERPHRPVYDAPARLFDDVRECLTHGPGSEPVAEPAHNDLTPWNLRRDHRGVVWLYDWEDWAPAPPQADRVYFHAAVRALTDRDMPPGLPRATIEHWEKQLLIRESDNAADLGLNRRMLSALELSRSKTDTL